MCRDRQYEFWIELARRATALRVSVEIDFDVKIVGWAQVWPDSGNGVTTSCSRSDWSGRTAGTAAVSTSGRGGMAANYHVRRAERRLRAARRVRPSRRRRRGITSVGRRDSSPSAGSLRVTWDESILFDLKGVRTFVRLARPTTIDISIGAAAVSYVRRWTCTSTTSGSV